MNFRARTCVSHEVLFEWVKVRKVGKVYERKKKNQEENYEMKSEQERKNSRIEKQSPCFYRRILLC